jgi:hypothetical protein
MFDVFAMFDGISDSWALALVGLIGGLVLGLAAPMPFCSGPLEGLRPASLSLTEIPTRLRSYPDLIRAATGAPGVPVGLLISSAITGAAVDCGAAV